MNRRGFITGVSALIAAPAVVRAASLMPVSGIVLPTLQIGNSALVVYGHSLCMAALDDAQVINAVYEHLLGEWTGCVEYQPGDRIISPRSFYAAA